MNREFVNKIIKVITGILKNFKIVKNKMPDNNVQPQQPQQPVTTIGANTIIQFTLKSFLATIGSILGLFVAFYFMVVVPKAKDVETYQKQLYEQQQKYVSEEFGKVNAAIKSNTQTIGDLSTRFEDLNTTIENSGGGFGGNHLTSGTPAVTEVETALASN